MASKYLAAGLLVVVVVAGVAAGLYFTNRSVIGGGSQSQNSSSKVQVVAAENFWGSLVAQLGGIHTQVTSIVSDPNTDPHEYESNTANAVAISDASLVIINGAGYDVWAQKIIASSSHPNQKVLNVQQLLGQPGDANPHFWYSPYYVNKTVHAMYSTLVSIDPGDSTYYKQQYASLNSSLGEYNHRISVIRQQFAGTKVAATEDIFVYLANATGLDVVSPVAFMQAVAEGNDPPANSVAQFQQLLQLNGTSILVYNQQTVTPLTDNMKALAAKQGIPIVGVTETIQPPDVTFQVWMNAECIAIQNALNAKALGQ
jgi:zinc/manganese transport system substrate-binding protein